MGEPRAQSEGVGLARVEREGEEGPVAEHGDEQRHQQCPAQYEQVLLADGEDVAEQDAGQVHGEGLRTRHDDHTDREHADEEQADAGVLGESRGAPERGDARGHDGSAGHRSQQQVAAEQGGQRHPGSSPCDMASPRKAIPLSTTQVPARAQMADTRMPPHKALCTNVTSNGAVNQSMRRTLQ